jgi:hypothetical protein
VSLMIDARPSSWRIVNTLAEALLRQFRAALP